MQTIAGVPVVAGTCTAAGFPVCCVIKGDEECGSPTGKPGVCKFWYKAGQKCSDLKSYYPYSQC